MRFKIEIGGVTPIIMHNGTAGLDTRSPAKLEMASIAKKKGGNRTEIDDMRLRELECQVSLYFDDNGLPTLPLDMIRANIERAARKLKQGPQVREGLIVTDLEFHYDTALGTAAEELGKSLQFTAAVVVQRARILRTRAKFDKWSVIFFVETDDELVDKGQLEQWLDIGGRRIGLGDWRPEKSGQYGRYEVISIEQI